MALNIKALIPTPEHPPVTQYVVEPRANPGADHEKGFEPERGAKERGLLSWKRGQTKFKLGGKLLQLLDVL